MQPLHSGIISIPGSPKTGTWNLSTILPPQITENHKIVFKVGSRRLPKSTIKSIKTDIWASVCPLGVPQDPGITKMVVEVRKMEPQGLQNHEFGHKKRPIAAINLSAAASCQGDSFLVISNPPVCNWQFASLVSGAWTRYLVPGTRYQVPGTWYLVPGTC